MNDFLKAVSFPYSGLRKGQAEFLKQVYQTIEDKGKLLVCAPTGLGKTVAALAPALKFAKENDLTVICLTSRQTQANQIIKTIKDISRTSGKNFNYCAFTGKRHMCAHPERELYAAADFNDFCTKMRETGKCKYYQNVKNEDLQEQREKLLDLVSHDFFDVEGYVNLFSSNAFCPYYLLAQKSHKADVIICDYNYVFSPSISENFLMHLGRPLEECIVIVDEAHNLPDRVRNNYSVQLSSELIKNAAKELNDYIKSSQYDSIIFNLRKTFDEMFIEHFADDKKESLILKEEFISLYTQKFNETQTLRQTIETLFDISRKVKEDRVVSHCGRIGAFLDKWTSADEKNYVRIFEKEDNQGRMQLCLKLKCIDSAFSTQEVLSRVYASVLMSATLSPLPMFQDILGLPDAKLL